jgi:hypothetical protein
MTDRRDLNQHGFGVPMPGRDWTEDKRSLTEAGQAVMLGEPQAWPIWRPLDPRRSPCVSIEERES